MISTHALTEGDTAIFFSFPSASHFNSRPHGGRRIAMILLHFGVDFNSRPHGGRLLGWFVLASLLDFNSRPHGGRLPHPAPLPGASGFQLTPSRRATIFSIDILLILVYFNSRPHGGRRGEHHSDCAHENYFNSRPHGGRPFSCIMYSVTENISTHALTEGDGQRTPAP